MAINKDQTIADVLKTSPKTVQVFLRHGMHCFGCHISTSETVEEAARAHKVDPDVLLRELNEVGANGSAE